MQRGIYALILWVYDHFLDFEEAVSQLTAGIAP
jgi:hypothetical protein